MIRRASLLICLPILFSSLATPGAAQQDNTVKVFVLAGQSNMEGKAKNTLLEHQANAPETKELFAHLRANDQWIERDDAFIKYLNRKGKLTIGYGSPGRTGMELEFGTVLANHLEQPVLLIKAAWGGHSLFKLFRSPSAGLPSEEVLQQELAQAQQRVQNNNEKQNRSEKPPTMDDIVSVYGSSYRNMLSEVKETREGFATMFPELKGKQLEIAGFVWFQGWNDQYGAEGEYAANMQHFIRDVRKDLQAPNMPFVICMMGQSGSKPAKGAMATIQEAQQSMENIPDFRGSVRAIRTDILVDKAAEELFPTWKENVAQWEKTGSDFPYHYLGSAIWFQRIGRSTADAMLQLMQ